MSCDAENYSVPLEFTQGKTIITESSLGGAGETSTSMTSLSVMSVYQSCHVSSVSDGACMLWSSPATAEPAGSSRIYYPAKNLPKMSLLLDLTNTENAKDR